jgi:calcineurin-like phosphoesterase family protein
MHEVMIERWNSVVRPNDTVWHLGDFCFGRKNLVIAERLYGKKKLVMGNHDNYDSNEYLKYFDKLYGVTFWKNCILSHVPVHINQLGSRAFLNVHGHLHSKKVMEGSNIINPFEDRNYMNVSCEQNNLTPFHADEILLRLKEIQE